MDNLTTPLLYQGAIHLSSLQLHLAQRRSFADSATPESNALTTFGENAAHLSEI